MNKQPLPASEPFLADAGQRWALVGVIIGIALVALHVRGKLPDFQPFLGYFSDIIMTLLIGSYGHAAVRSFKGTTTAPQPPAKK